MTIQNVTLSEDIIFPDDLANVVNEKINTLTGNNPLFGGLDFGKINDHSAISLCRYSNGAIEEVGGHIFDHMPYGEVSRQVAKLQQKQFMTAVGYDATGVGIAAIELFHKMDINFLEITMSNKSKNNLMNMALVGFETGKIKLARNSPVREQMELQNVKKTAAGNTIYEHPSGTHDDLFWAFIYSVYAGLETLVHGDSKGIIRRGPNTHTIADEDRITNEAYDDLLDLRSGSKINDKSKMYDWDRNKWRDF